MATIKGRCASGTGEAVHLPRAAEREVADLLPMEADPADARGVLESLPFWFHTFALNPAAGVYPPGWHGTTATATPALYQGTEHPWPTCRPTAYV